MISNRPSHLRPLSRAMALEPRLLFDGAGAVAAIDGLDMGADHPAEARFQDTVPAAEARPAETLEPSTGGVLVIIDARADQVPGILAGMPAGATIRVVDIDESGLAVIGEELANGGRFDAIHVLSHGTPGSFTLGTDQLDNDTLTDNADILQAWATHLSADADILLYGCDIAQGAEGQAFISELARLTGADIAASTNATGSATRGGDWILESATGSIEAGIFALTGYDGLLAATAINDAEAATPRVTTEDESLALSGISVAGGAADEITLRIQTTDGTATLGTIAGLTFSGGNGSTDFSVTGTIADINGALATLSYVSSGDGNSSISGFSPAIKLSVTAGGVGNLTISDITVTAVNDAPDLSTGTDLLVDEGGSAALALQQLATDADALDVDILTGQQVIGQMMLIIDGLPTKGTLSYMGGIVAAGQVIPVTDIGNLRYTHNGTDLTADDSDGFDVTVSDGGGDQTSGTIGITIRPVNQAPTISGGPQLIEGQVKVVAPTIGFGDAYDTLGNATIEITAVDNAGQGMLFFDANGDGIVDAGEAITAGRIFTSAEAADLMSRLKFSHNGAEPNAPGATSPSYTIKVTDAGGGAGAGEAKSVTETIVIDVLPNNDDPTLSNAHATPETALGVDEGTSTPITSTHLQISDADRNPADTSQTTPSEQLVYTIEATPGYGEIQLYIGSNAGWGTSDGTGPGPYAGADGWIVLGAGGRFTQQDVDAGRVRFVQTSSVADGTTVADSFQFTVRDSAFGYDVWTDPANPSSPREGGLRDAPTDAALAVQTFWLDISGNDDSHDIYEGDPRPAWPGFGGASNQTLEYSFDALVMNPGNTNGGAEGVWQEANVVVPTVDGNLITRDMLEYRITRTARDDDGNTIAVIPLPPTETVYTLTEQPSNGHIERQLGDGTWEVIPTNGQFTQDDINNGRIRFIDDGSEDHSSHFGFRVSDGTEHSYDGSFLIDVTPTNDRPTSSGSNSAIVAEGSGNTVRLGSSHLGMNDVDESLDPTKRVDEGAKDFLWFQVNAQPVDGGASTHGHLERWDGSAWVTITPGEWLPSTLLTSTVDGEASGLRYVHDGSEPLTYHDGPRVSFSFTVRDDLANPDNPFATNTTAPTVRDGSAQSNESAAATVMINVIPVNDPPEVADRPGDADPTISATITNGGALTGANEVLANVPEGSEATITSAHLTAVDRDNTTIQRQYRITDTPTQGTLLLNGVALGKGSTFTQADIDANRLSYRHGGAEPQSPTSDSLGTYHDKFHFVVNDGVLEDGGDAVHDNVFLITLASTNDKPLLSAPSGPIDIDSATAANNPVPGFSVDDPDLANPTTSTDFLQVTVRLLDKDSTPVADYANGLAGGGVQIGHAASGVVVTKDGNNDILQFQGTRAQVNAALAGLTVTFDNDADQVYQLEVIVDDRLRDATGALDASGDDANGGELNQAATPGGAPTAVDSVEHDWLTEAADPDSGNIASKTVELRASHTNDAPTFTGPTAITVNEDVRSRVGGGDGADRFVVEDAESRAFDTPVSVTVSVPAGQGNLYVGASGTPGSVTPAAGHAVTVSGNGTGSLTLTGRADDIQAVLNGRNFADTAADANTGLFYTSPGNVNHNLNDVADGDVTLSLMFSEGASAIGGDMGSGSVANPDVTVSTALTITAINDAPTIATDSGSITIAGTAATAVSGFVVNDVDADDGYVDGESDGVIQVTVRLLDGSTPLDATDYASAGGLGMRIDTTAAGHGATVDATHDGAYGVLELRGTREQINAYLAGLTVQFENLGDANVDMTYHIEVIADDRLRDAVSGNFTNPANPVANGGTQNQQSGLPPVPDTDTFDPYGTKVADYGVYNVVSNSRALFISTINDPGRITANNVTVDEGSATLDLTAANANITLDDPDDNGASTMEVTVHVGAGTISAVGGSGGLVTGTGSDTITITGATEAQIDSRLKAITVAFPDPAGPAGAADWNGSFDVTIVYNDKGNTGTRPATLVGDTGDARSGNGDYDYADGSSNELLTTRIITVTVNNVNDAPTRTTDRVTLAAGTEDAHNAGETVAGLFGGVFSDELDEIGGNGSDANDLAGIAITTNNATPAQGTWQYSTDGGSTWTDLPEVSESNALLLASSDLLRFDPAPDFHGTPGSLVARLVDDSQGAITSGDRADVSGSNSGGSTPYSNSSNAVTLGTSVINVNDRPAISDASIAAIEDVSDGSGALVSALPLGYSDAADDQSSISGGGNAATPFGGIAIVGDTTPASEGTWQYSTDGSTWTDIPAGLAAGNALILPTTASLRFTPVADFNGPITGGLQIHAADMPQAFGTGQDISGALALGQASNWSIQQTLGADVAPRNDAPAFTHTPSNPSATENSSTGSGTSIDPVKLLGSGTVSDIDLATTPALDGAIFGAGSITVTLTDGIAGDVLQLGDGLVAGSNGIAGIAGGNGNTPLVITFTSAASVTQVEAALEAIEYRNTSDDPTDILSGTPKTSRSYTVELSDGNNVQAGGDAGGPDPLSVSKAGTITIVAVNDPPTATGNSNSVTEDSGTPATGNVITDNDGDGTDSDPDTPPADLKISAIQPAGQETTAVPAGPGGTTVTGKYGSLTIREDGSYSYTLDDANPAVNALKDGETLNDEVFTYTLSDGDAADTATLTITINGHTDGAPQIIPVDGNGAATGEATVYEKGLTSVADTSETSTGTITVRAPDELKEITIGGTTLTLAELLTLSPSNPSAIIDTGEGELRITGISGDPTSGTGASISYIYTLKAPQDQPGTSESIDTIPLEVRDAKDVTSTGTLTIQIIDDVPTAANDAGTVRATETLDVPGSGGVLLNDQSGADGWAAGGAVVGVEAGTGGAPGTGVGTAITGSYGTLTLNPDGSYTYVANPAAPGAPPTVTDTFTYTVRDADGDEATATLTITVLNNRPPEPHDDVRSTPEDTPVSGNVLSGSDGDVADGDPDGDPLTVTQVTIDGVTTTVPVDGSPVTIDIPGSGTLVIDSSGAYTFTPLPDWNGTVPPIVYTVDDGTGAGNATATATLHITVTPVPDIVPDSGTTHVGQPITIDVLANDRFAGTPVISDTTPPAHGSIVVNPDGTITYTPHPGYAGTDTFTYTATSGGITETTTVTITVLEQNPVEPPGPYFWGDRVDDRHQELLPFEPIVYVHGAVLASQAERDWNDPRGIGRDPSMVESGLREIRSPGMELGFDPALFVTGAVHESQRQAEFLGRTIEGRHGRVSLSSDGYLSGPGLLHDSAMEGPSWMAQQRTKGTTSSAPASGDAGHAPDETGLRPTATLIAATDSPEGTIAGDTDGTIESLAEGSAPSFTEQLRNGVSRLPLAARRI